ncbi:hypothetical protein RB653_005322 [Dictyostelium firmibasis]|uniref:S1-like domain-containing protein n=1 Tax=Dictyostelium firmibasis TaxID=79012 RepID=A0AAN7U122_9MYCE
MSHARKHVTNQSLNSSLILENDQSIVKVIDMRGGNVVEVQYPNGSTVLAIIPSKFKNVLWIKKGNYAIIDKEDESSKSSQVKCSIVHILSKENVKGLVKSNDWPKEFDLEDKNQRQQQQKPLLLTCPNPDEDDGGLSDLGVNPNRKKFGRVDSDEEDISDDDDDEEEDN